MEKLLTMLIVDDSEFDRQVLRGIFECDYNILEAEDGEGALALLRSGQRIDVVVLDVTLPNQDGFNLLEIIKNDADLQSIPVIMNAYNDNEDADVELKALELGAEEFIAKDQDARVIGRRVTNLMKRMAGAKNLAQLGEPIAYQPMRDSLTGIYTKEFFYAKAKEYIDANKDETCVICTWNIDRFKVVNELYTSSLGDMVLRSLATVLMELVNENGVCARMSGDQFLFCTTERFVNEHLEEIEVVLNGQEIWAPVDYIVQLHMGVYVIEDEKMPLPLMCDRADLAMRRIKESYIQRINYYSDELKDAILDEQELINEMEFALRNNQFVIMLQPIVDTETKRTISAEALIRWNHPVKGMINPGVFIPLFERNGFIAMLDLFVCEEVCKFQAKQKRTGRKSVPISVNISRFNFYKAEFVKEIMEMLKKYDLSPEMIKFEITEGSYQDNPKGMMDAIKEFQSRSFKILMDDFGSGYSSLNMLKDFNIDILKIDMKFINDLETSDRANNILYTILQIAKALDMETVAEGVETQTQYELLASMGCDSIQGYFFSKPISKDEFENRLENEEHVIVEPNTIDARQTILVVDDQMVDREIIKKMVGNKYHIMEAADGVEGFTLLKKNCKEIDLMIADIHMPGMTGLELLERKREIISMKDIPVIMVTAYGEKENEEAALSLGALDIINKPYDAQLVRKRIENMLKISEANDKKRKINERRRRL